MAINMRRFLLTSFAVLALVVGAAPATHAQYDSSQNMEAALDQTAATAANSVSDPAAAKAANDYKPESTDSAYNTIMIKIMTLFAWLVGVAMITLNYAAYYTVVTMGTYVNDLSAIGVTWSILRDIGNIFLIFGFLAIGITTILNVDWYGGGKKMLPMMFVAAIFLNFSLFITEAVIDTGNLFATQFYTQINDGNLPTAATLVDEGISSKIMSQLGLTTIYGQAQNNERAKDIFKGGNPWIIGFMGIILFIILAFVLFSLAFVLIARFVILIFLIILAPVGFAGLAVPQLASVAKKWWDKLFEQTITAPVLLLMLYIALTIITDVRFLTGFGSDQGADWLGTIRGDIAGFAPVLLSFLVAMGLLLAVVIFAKNLSAFGASGATKLASKLSGVSVAAAAPGWVGRNTFGLAGNYAAKKLRDTGFGRSFVGRGIAGTLEKRVAGASFDIRNTDFGKSASKVGLNLGKGQTGGYKADLEARVKSYEAASAGITGGAKEKEEKQAARQAKATIDATREARDKAEAEHRRIEPALAQENARQKAEVERLEKEKERFGAGTFAANEIDKKLIPARESLVKSNEALKAANDKLTDAKTALATAMNDEAAARKNVGTAKKEAQSEYADRLESIWGRIPLAGTAATAAAPRVRSNIGKTADQRAIEGLLKEIKDKAGASGGGEKKEEKEEAK
ncbi:MAG: hypothetical protein WC814_00320 [Candidatus Paceibacterota bacterium]|jgi:hypothetical protein